MAGGRQQGSRLRRPWSVCRANTFDLSDEMISMVLTGEGAGSQVRRCEIEVERSDSWSVSN